MPTQVLELVNSDRRQRPTGENRQISVRLHPQTAEQVEKLAFDVYSTKAQILRVLIEEGLRSFAAKQD